MANRETFELLETTASGEGREFSVLIPKTCPWFEGHFPGRPVLPAIGQLELVRRLLGHVETDATRLRAADRLRFVRPVAPGDELVVRLLVDGEAATFRIERANEIVSEGKLRIGSPERP